MSFHYTVFITKNIGEFVIQDPIWTTQCIQLSGFELLQSGRVSQSICLNDLDVFRHTVILYSLLM